MVRRTIAYLLVLFAATAFLGCKEKPAEDADKPKEEAGAAAAGAGEAAGAPAGDKAAGAGAAGKEAPADEATPEETAAAVEPAAAAAPAGDAFKLASRLPGDAMFALSVPNLQLLLDRLGRAELVAKFAQFTGPLERQVTAMAGSNLLDPANLPSVGVRPDGELGLALYGATEPEVIVFALPLSDQATAEGFVKKLLDAGGKPYNREEVSGGVLLSDDRGKIAMLFTSDVCFVAVREDGEVSAVDFARRIAGTTPDNSLASGAAFTKVQFHAGVMHAFVDFARFMPEILADSTRKSFAEEELERATAGGNQDEIAMWAEQAERQRTRNESARKVLEAVFGPISGVGLTLDIEATAITWQIDVATTSDAALRTYLRNASAGSVLSKASTSRPLFYMAGSVDPQPTIELFKAVAAADGDDFAEFQKEMIAETGIDPQTEILDLLTGELGFVVNGALDTNREPAPTDFGGDLVLGVTDAAKVDAVLTKLAALPPMADKVRREGAAYVFDVPEWRSVYVAAAGGYLTVSTDAGFQSRVAEGGGGFAGSVEPASLRDVYAAPSALSYTLDQVAMMYLFVAGKKEESKSAAGVDAATAAQIAELDRQIEALEQAHEQAEMATMTTLFKALGTTAFAVQVTDSGLSIRGGQYTGAESVPAAIATGIEAGLAAMQPDTSSEELYALRERRWQLAAGQGGAVAIDAVPAEWGPTCKAYFDKVDAMCAQPSANLAAVCDGYKQSIDQMRGMPGLTADVVGQLEAGCQAGLDGLAQVEASLAQIPVEPTVEPTVEPVVEPKVVKPAEPVAPAVDKVKAVCGQWETSTAKFAKDCNALGKRLSREFRSAGFTFDQVPRTGEYRAALAACRTAAKATEACSSNAEVSKALESMGKL